MTKPCIVVVGLDSIFIDEVLQSLTGSNQDQTQNQIDWTIDTKYYTADVHLCPLTSKKLVDEPIANATEMLIVLLDPSQMNSRTKLDSWLPFLSVLNDCETKFIVVRQMDHLSTTLSRFEIKQWCSEHQYELLELEKRATSETENDDEDDEDEQLYPDIYGIPRLMQTLHVHQWSNMNLKDRREINRNLVAQLKAKMHFDDDDVDNNNKIDDVGRANTTDAQRKENDDGKEEQQENREQNDRCETTTLNHHDDRDAFGMENLFEQMRRYKDEADQLQGDERKTFAEKVILSLWKSIGVDDELDESDEENLPTDCS